MTVSKKQLDTMLEVLNQGLQQKPEYFEIGDESPKYYGNGHTVTQLGRDLFFEAGVRSVGQIKVIIKYSGTGQRFVGSLCVIGLHNNIVYSPDMVEPEHTDAVTFDQMIELVRQLYNI